MGEKEQTLCLKLWENSLKNNLRLVNKVERTLTLVKFSSVLSKTLQLIDSSFVSLYRSLEHLRGKKNHLCRISLQAPDSWIMYPADQ